MMFFGCAGVHTERNGVFGLTVPECTPWRLDRDG